MNCLTHRHLHRLWDPSYGSNACRAGTLTTKPSLQQDSRYQCGIYRNFVHSHFQPFQCMLSPARPRRRRVPAVPSCVHTLGVEDLDWKGRQVPILLPPPLGGLDFSSTHSSRICSPVPAGLTQNLQLLLLAAGPSCVAAFTDICPLLGRLGLSQVQ